MAAHRRPWAIFPMVSCSSWPHQRPAYRGRRNHFRRHLRTDPEITGGTRAGDGSAQTTSPNNWWRSSNSNDAVVPAEEAQAPLGEA